METDYKVGRVIAECNAYHLLPEFTRRMEHREGYRRQISLKAFSGKRERTDEKTSCNEIYRERKLSDIE